MTSLLLTGSKALVFDSSLLPKSLLLDARNPSHLAARTVSATTFDALIAHAPRIRELADEYGSNNDLTDRILLNAVSEMLGLDVAESPAWTHLVGQKRDVKIKYADGREAPANLGILIGDGQRLICGLDFTLDNPFIIVAASSSLPLPITRRPNWEIANDFKASGYELIGDSLLISSIAVNIPTGWFGLYNIEDDLRLRLVYEYHANGEVTTSNKASVVGERTSQLLQSSRIKGVALWGNRGVTTGSLEEIIGSFSGQIGAAQLNLNDYFLQSDVDSLLESMPETRQFVKGDTTESTLLLCENAADNTYDILDRYSTLGQFSEQSLARKFVPVALDSSQDYATSRKTAENRISMLRYEIRELNTLIKNLDVDWIAKKRAQLLAELAETKNALASSNFNLSVAKLFPNLALDAVIELLRFNMYPIFTDESQKPEDRTLSLSSFLNAQHLLILASDPNGGLSAINDLLDQVSLDLQRLCLEATAVGKEIQREKDYRGTKPHKSLATVHESDFSSYGSLIPTVVSTTTLEQLFPEALIASSAERILVVSEVKDACGTIWVPAKYTAEFKSTSIVTLINAIRSKLTYWLARSAVSAEATFASLVQQNFGAIDSLISEISVLDSQIWAHNSRKKKVDNLQAELLSQEAFLGTSLQTDGNVYPLAMIDEFFASELSGKNRMTLSGILEERIAGAQDPELRQSYLNYEYIRDSNNDREVITSDKLGVVIPSVERAKLQPLLSAAINESGNKVASFVQDRGIMSVSVDNTPSNVQSVLSKDSDYYVAATFTDEATSVRLSVSALSVAVGHSHAAEFHFYESRGTNHWFRTRLLEINYLATLPGVPGLTGPQEFLAWRDHSCDYTSNPDGVGRWHWHNYSPRYNNLPQGPGQFTIRNSGWFQRASFHMQLDVDSTNSYRYNVSNWVGSDGTSAWGGQNEIRVYYNDDLVLTKEGPKGAVPTWDVTVDLPLKQMPSIQWQTVTGQKSNTYSLLVYIEDTKPQVHSGCRSEARPHMSVSSFDVAIGEGSLRKLAVYRDDGVSSAVPINTTESQRQALAKWNRLIGAIKGSAGVEGNACRYLQGRLSACLLPSSLDVDGVKWKLTRLATSSSSRFASFAYVAHSCSLVAIDGWVLPKAYRIGDRYLTDTQLTELHQKLASVELPIGIVEALFGNSELLNILPSSSDLQKDIVTRSYADFHSLTLEEISLLAYAAAHYAKKHGLPEGYGSITRINQGG